MSRAIGRREYSRELAIETRRPYAPRNLAYNTSTNELTWTGPIEGPRYTHFNIRLDDDRNAPSFCLPAGTSSLIIMRSARIIITCWNETVFTESDAARIEILTLGEWTDSLTAVFGPVLSYQVEYDLSVIAANFTVTSPVAAAPNRRLLVYIFQDATTEYVAAFDPASFVDSGNVFIDLSMGWVREYAGRSDGKWYPIALSITFDPSI